MKIHFPCALASARVAGVATGPVRLAFMLLISVVIAVAMKIVGILLIVSMLIIPAAIARRFAATPEHMAAMAALAGLRAPVDGFFDAVTVNAEDAALRANRLRLLARIRETLHRVADFSAIQG